MTENLPVLNLISKVYNTFLPQLRSGEQSNFEVWKKCVNYNNLCCESHFFQTIFLDLELWQLVISKPDEVGKSCIPNKTKDWALVQNAALVGVE